jgi:hypothetical protein
MASSVVTGVDELLENFTSVAEWTGAAITSVAGGRTGNAGNLSGSSNGTYAITAPNQGSYATVGFAFKTSNIVTIVRPLFSFRDGSANDQITLRTETTGALTILSGTAVVLGTSAAGLIAAATWNYVEVQTFIHATLGSVVVRVNGTSVITLTGVNTQSVAANTVAQLFLRGPGTGQSTQFDDLYLTMGPGATFKGSITIP